MFTGIIETQGEVVSVRKEGTNSCIRMKASFTHELRVDQSVAHNGVCLTVVKIEGEEYEVVAVDETLKKTNLGALTVGSKINLERCTKVGDRLDGHIVQGHVDTTGMLERMEEKSGSWMLHFKHAPGLNFITVEKGSITVNGVSLTVVDSDPLGFSVTLIPYTFEHTNLGQLKQGDTVNLEFDIIGKYVARLMGART